MRCTADGSTDTSSVTIDLPFSSVQSFNCIQSYFSIQLHHRDNLLVQLVTIGFAFEDCNDMIVQFEWYLLPADTQQMLPIICHFSQQPVQIKCFGSKMCDRETFKYVSMSRDCLETWLSRDKQFNCFVFMVVKFSIFFRWSGKHSHFSWFYEIFKIKSQAMTHHMDMDRDINPI